jgi:hypothetical protein
MKAAGWGDARSRNMAVYSRYRAGVESGPLAAMRRASSRVRRCEIDAGQRLPVGVAHDEARVRLLATEQGWKRRCEDRP